MISPRSVQEIIDAARIEDIVGDFVTLKRRGANLQGLCPFHNEKTPSFSVNPARNIFKCFGCGKGGDPVTFVMEHEQLSYPETLRYIAKKYNIAIEETQVSETYVQEKQIADSLYIVNERALKFFDAQLFESDKGKSVGLSYFKSRGFREETIKKWGLGFSDDAVSLTKTLQSEGYQLDLLKKLGLTTQYDRDFFRNRVMFTIFGLTGKPIAFAGRILQKDANAPKYINSPETDIYLKSKVLYGMNFARRTIQQEDECILCEGYTDVISLSQAGVENVVASSGTSLTVEQIRQIKRFTPNIKVIYDGDAAGIKAALRGTDLILEEDMNVRVVLLPHGEDPDSYVQKVGTAAFKDYIKQEATDFILFKTKLLLDEAGNDPIRLSKLIKEIVGSIAKIPDPIKRQLYVRECAQIMRVDEAILIGETGRIVKRGLEDKAKKGNAAPSVAPPDVPFPTEEIAQPNENQPYNEPNYFRSEPQKEVGDEAQERDIVRILVLYGTDMYDAAQNITVAQFILTNIADVINAFDNPLYQKIVTESLESVQKSTPLSMQQFLAHENRDIQSFAATVGSIEYGYSDNWENKFHRPLETQKMPDLNFGADAILAIKRFKLKKIMRLCTQNQLLIKKASDEQNMETLMRQMKIQQKLVEMRNALAAELNTVILR